MEREVHKNKQPQQPHRGWKLFGKFALTCAMAGCLAFDGVTGYKAYQAHQRIEQLSKSNTETQNQINTLQKAMQTKIMYVDQNGSLFTPDDVNNMQLIKEALQKRYTFTNSTEYRNNWNSLHNVILDSSFFANNFPLSLDNKPASFLSSLHDKYLCNRVNVYKASNGQYIAIATYVPYHNNKDLAWIDKLVPMSQGFVITCANGKIATIHQINNWGLRYSADD